MSGADSNYFEIHTRNQEEYEEMPAELSKTYNPKEVEERLYEWWESQGYFTPKIEPGKKPFVIVIPLVLAFDAVR